MKKVFLIAFIPFLILSFKMGLSQISGEHLDFDSLKKNDSIEGDGPVKESIDYLENKSEKQTEPLSTSKIIKLTNRVRSDHNLPQLTENNTLNLIAKEKVENMFEDEYFAHTSPDGKEASDLANEFNYHFILIGENLAKGIFQSNKALIDGWMDSPGHRENILKEKYGEIGVAAKWDEYNGKRVWMAVQIFGTPASACPTPSRDLPLLINKLEERADDLKLRIELADDELEELEGEDYNNKVKLRNRLVEVYNKIGEEMDDLVNKYNNQIEERNNCIAGY